MLCCTVPSVLPQSSLVLRFRPRTVGARSYGTSRPIPFAQRCVSRAEDACRFTSPAVAHGALHRLVAEHVVQGRVVFPGAGYLEMARATACAVLPPSATSGASLDGVFFLQPLAVETAGWHIECAVSVGRFEVLTAHDGDARGAGGQTAVHCSGGIGSCTQGTWRAVDHACVRGRRCRSAADMYALYDGFDSIGLQYGPGYRTLARAWGGEGTATARLKARGVVQGGVVVHPADLDDALCLGAVPHARSSTGSGGETRLPFAVDDAHLQRAAGLAWAVRLRMPLP